MAPVSVRKVAEELDGLPSEVTAYLNCKTGEVFSMTEEEAELLGGYAEEESMRDRQREALPKIRDVLEGEDWLPLPSKHDIHEWSIMRDFTHSITDPSLQEEFQRAIHGSGAFRHFKNTVYQHGLEEKWSRFKADALEQIVVDWLEGHAIPYTHDDRPPSAE